MIRWRNGTVLRVVGGWPGAVELAVRVDVSSDAEPDTVLALAFPRLVGHPDPGDRVLLNTNAPAAALGTGGYAMVVAVPDRLPPETVADTAVAGTAGMVKARYTPLQALTAGVDDVGSPHHGRIAGAASLGGLPVAVADLHSALPAIVAAVLADRPGTAVAYVQTDGAALPLWFSRTVAGLAGWLCGTVTVGQAFGGDLEASTLHNGLLAAREVLGAEVAVVAQGPGNLGTATAWGFSGVAAGEAVNAAAVLGGRPVGALRISGADPRPRHRGLSHHSATAYGRVALAPADLPVPAGLAGLLGDPLARAVARDLAGLGERHRIVEVPTAGLWAALLAAPVPLATMGRSLDDDPAYFLSCAAAGRHAAALLDQPAAPAAGPSPPTEDGVSRRP